MSDVYIRHALQHPWTARVDVRQRVYDLPVCARCERVAFRDKGYAANGVVRCPFCGHTGPGGPPMRIHAKEV